MAMRKWVPTLLKSLCDTGSWESYGGPHTIISYREIGSQGKRAVLYLIYVEEDEELYLAWDPKLLVSSKARELYEKAIDSVNDYIVEFESGFGQFAIEPSGCILYAYSFEPMLEKLQLITVEDISIIAGRICNMCNNIYLAILEVKHGRDMNQILRLVCAPVVGHA